MCKGGMEKYKLNSIRSRCLQSTREISDNWLCLAHFSFRAPHSPTLRFNYSSIISNSIKLLLFKNSKLLVLRAWIFSLLLLPLPVQQSLRSSSQKLPKGHDWYKVRVFAVYTAELFLPALNFAPSITECNLPTYLSTNLPTSYLPVQNNMFALSSGNHFFF